MTDQRAALDFFRPFVRFARVAIFPMFTRTARSTGVGCHWIGQ